MQKISGFMFWVLLGLAIAIVPIACATDNTSTTDANPDSMTKT